MGTFHEDKGELHGVTVVVRTRGPRTYVGRCDERTPDGILLLDADLHEEGRSEKTRAEYLASAARYGVFPRLARVLVPAAEVASVERLGALPR